MWWQEGVKLQLLSTPAVKVYAMELFLPGNPAVVRALLAAAQH